jgi:uncharacterized protein YktB (UPF0637 family)
MPTVLPESDREVVTYLHRRGSNVRIQLEAIDDERNNRGQTTRRGYTKYAHFNKGMFTTNIAEIQDLLEGSYAYKAQEVERQSVIQERALQQQLDSLMSVAEKNPELAKELQSRLKKMQMAAAATRRAQDTGVGEGTITVSGEEEQNKE